MSEATEYANEIAQQDNDAALARIMRGRWRV